MKLNTTIEESELTVVDPERIRFRENEFCLVDFLNEVEFVEAVTEYNLERRSPVFRIESDKQIEGYSEDVRAIYFVVCDNRFLLRYYKMGPIKEGETESA